MKHLKFLLFCVFSTLILSCSSDDDENELPEITTTDVSNINNISASSGGMVLNDFDDEVTARGVCWSTNPKPTISNSKTTDGNGIGSFTSSITGLMPNTTYYVRAYATNSKGTSYGNQVSFTTTNFS